MKTPYFTFVCAALAVSGCALMSKSEGLDVRWFTPEHVKPHVTAAGAAGAPNEDAQPLELGRITSGAHLREKMVYRNAAWEIGYRDERRWTERPDAFVRRELGRTLFEERGFRRAISGTAPTLEIELLAFEELLAKPLHAARVQLRMILHDGQIVLHEETLTVDKPLAADAKVEDIVAATAEALDSATALVAERVASVLNARGR